MGPHTQQMCQACEYLEVPGYAGSSSSEDSGLNALSRGEQQFSDVSAARDEESMKNGAQAVLENARHVVAGAAFLLWVAFR
jgi:hypothetical protein